MFILCIPILPSLEVLLQPVSQLNHFLFQIALGKWYNTAIQSEPEQGPNIHLDIKPSLHPKSNSKML